MNPIAQATFDLIAFGMLLAFYLTPFVGCAYLVFWRGASPWWFVLAALISSSVSGHKNLGAAP